MSYAKSEKTKARLVDHTARLVRTVGYHGTGVSDILEHSGVPRGSLYHHFPGGKEELASASVRHSTEAILASLQRFAEASDGPVGAVVDFCDYYIAELEASDFRKGCPLATISLEVTGHVPPVHDACADGFGAILDFFTTELTDAGVPSDRAGELAAFTVASIEGALLVAKATRDTTPVAVVRDRLVADLGAAIEEAT